MLVFYDYAFIVFIYSTDNVFLLCFIYCTYLNSLNADTVWDKGIKTVVKYSEYYSP